MHRLTGSTHARVVAAAVAMVLGLALGACGGDDGDTTPTDTPTSTPTDPSTSTPTGTETPATGDPTGSVATIPDSGEGIWSVNDGDLVVSRDYLQGEWCDDDGQSWSIEGDIARLVESGGAVGEFPLAVLFIDGQDVDLISQTDDEFVFGSSFEQVTFTRGSC